MPCPRLPLEICWQLVVGMAGSNTSQQKVILKKLPLHRAGRELQSWQQASPEQGYLWMGNAGCVCGCHSASGATAGSISAALYHLGLVPPCTRGSLLAPFWRCRANVPSREPRSVAA